MRLIGYLLLIAIGAVGASYFPLTAYLPPKETVMTAVRDNAPFLADWIPEEEPEEEAAPEAETVASPLDQDIMAEVDDGSTWTDFDVAELDALLTEMGMTSEVVNDEDGTSYVSATHSSGYSFFLNPRICEGGGCLGLNIYSVFDATATPEQLTALNERYAYMKFYSNENNELILQNYITADHGIARDNVKVNLSTFTEIMNEFESVLSDS